MGVAAVSARSRRVRPRRVLGAERATATANSAFGSDLRSPRPASHAPRPPPSPRPPPPTPAPTRARREQLAVDARREKARRRRRERVRRRRRKRRRGRGRKDVPSPSALSTSAAWFTRGSPRGRPPPRPTRAPRERARRRRAPQRFANRRGEGPTRGRRRPGVGDDVGDFDFGFGFVSEALLVDLVGPVHAPASFVAPPSRDGPRGGDERGDVARTPRAPPARSASRRRRAGRLREDRGVPPGHLRPRVPLEDARREDQRARRPPQRVVLEGTDPLFLFGARARRIRTPAGGSGPRRDPSCARATRLVTARTSRRSIGMPRSGAASTPSPRRRPGGGNAPLRSLVAEAQTGVAPAPRLAMQRLNRGPEPGLVRGERLRTVRFRLGGPPRGTPAGRSAHHVCVGRNASRYDCPPPSGTSAERERVRRRLGLRGASVPGASAPARYPGRPLPRGPPASIPSPPRPRSRLDRSRLHSAYSSFGGSARAARVGVALVRAGHLARRGDGRARQRRDAPT